MQITSTNSLPKSWRDALPIHPAAELFPMMSEPELKKWGKDIKKNGLKSQVAIYDSGVDTKGPRYSLLDGRNRLAAMEAVGLAPRLKFNPSRRGSGAWWSLKLEGGCEDDHPDVWANDIPQPLLVETDADPYAFVISANIHRRHLTAKGKRDLVAKLIKQQPNKSNRQIAEQAKVSPTTVGTTRSDMEAAGDVSNLDTRTDSKGRQQPSAKPKRWRDREDPYTWLMGGAPTLSAKAPKKPHPLKDEEMPTEEEAEESQQQDFYDQACHLVGLMGDATRQKFFAEMRRLYPQEVGAATPSDDLDLPQSLRRSAP
jgi:hypothetical protein